jgi:hypothetical protein
MNDPSRRERFREALRTAGISLGMARLTLAALEGLLRVADFRMLRKGTTARSLSYRYGSELGWAPAANSDSVAANVRTVDLHHNGLGLRDIYNFDVVGVAFAKLEANVPAIGARSITPRSTSVRWKRRFRSEVEAK